MLLAIDVESTGLVNEYAGVTDPLQPAPTQISAILAREEDGSVVTGLRDLYVVPPEGVTMTAEAERITGISRSMLGRLGVPHKAALSMVCHLARKAATVLTWGSHDREVLSIALRREGVDPDAALTRAGLPWIDVMRLATEPVGIRRQDGSCKYPRLTEAVRALLGREHDGAHDSWADAAATLEIYRALRDRGLVAEAA